MTAAAGSPRIAPVGPRTAPPMIADANATPACSFIVVYQQIENFLIAPKITAQTMKLHAGVAFASAIIGGAVLGPTGAILGLPAAAVIQGVLSSVGHRYEVVDDADSGAE